MDMKVEGYCWSDVKAIIQFYDKILKGAAKTASHLGL